MNKLELRSMKRVDRMALVWKFKADARLYRFIGKCIVKQERYEIS